MQVRCQVAHKDIQYMKNKDSAAKDNKMASKRKMLTNLKKNPVLTSIWSWCMSEQLLRFQPLILKIRKDKHGQGHKCLSHWQYTIFDYKTLHKARYHKDTYPSEMWQISKNHFMSYQQIYAFTKVATNGKILTIWPTSLDFSQGLPGQK